MVTIDFKLDASGHPNINAKYEQPALDGVLKVGGEVRPPRVIHAEDPAYSEEARQEKYEGPCVLALVVGPDGRPYNIRVARPLGKGLDEKAIEAVSNWKFEPARKDGRPVAVMINVEVQFRLSD